MKFLNSIFLLVATITLCNISYIRAEVQHKEVVDDIHRYIMGDNRDSDTSRRVFVSGVSNYQVAEEEAEAERERERIRLANQVSKTSYQRGESYTGGSAITLYRDYTNNCVLWAKYETGRTEPLGAGARKAINSQKPMVGAIGSEKNRIHAFVVVAINGDRITIHESNFYRGWITERVLSRSQILGYII